MQFWGFWKLATISIIHFEKIGDLATMDMSDIKVAKYILLIITK